MKNYVTKTIIVFAKYPPIQGGVSTLVYNTAINLASKGNKIHIITNSDEVEYCYKEIILDSDINLLNKKFNNRGFVKVYNISEISSSKFEHIPMSDAYESRLIGLGLEVALKIKKVDLIIGWYFQPYGVVASIVANYLRIQYLLIHAGSDISRLSNHRNLENTYKFMINNATKIITSKNKSVLKYYKKLGIRKEQFEYLNGGIRTPKYFKSNKIFKLNLYLNNAKNWINQLNINLNLKSRIITILNNNKFDSNYITIGIYGKIGNVKGNLELLQALETLNNHNIKYNFIQIPLGNDKTLEYYFNELETHERVLKNTYIIPPIAPWEIPGFIKSCDIVCYLENNFDIHHTPKIAMEILASGSCLFCSDDSIDKCYLSKMMVDKLNYVRIDTKNLINDLSNKLLYYSINNIERIEIATLGKYTINKVENSFSTENALSDSILKSII